jgi:hypothetical protein
MLELREWIATSRFPRKPWLILGKGPTFERRGEHRLGDYNLLGLNNVVGEMKVDVAHIIDIDVLERCADALAENCRYLLMPRRPHVRVKPGERLLEAFVAELPALRELDREGRLVWYNARTSAPIGASPVVRVRSFSSEAAIDILGKMGVLKIRSLGIDGGTGYAREFKGLVPLENGLPSFDAQFREIEDIVHDHAIDYDPLVAPMRVFVGTDQSQMVATRVLEHTIRRHASRPVRLIPMLDIPTPVPRDPDNRARTGFSFARFHIPRLAGRSGRALYLDADMQVFGDLAELYDMPFDDKLVLCTRQDEPPAAWRDSDWFHPGRQMSVMLLDCERLDWDIDRIIGGLDSGDYGYADLLFDLSIVDADDVGDHAPPCWNHLEHYEADETRLLHYTVVPTQPWKNDRNPLRELWESAFEEAKASGILYPSDVRQALRAGYLKRSIVGLPPANKPAKAVGRLVTKAESKLRQLDRRSELLRRPAVARVRSRFGLL